MSDKPVTIPTIAFLQNEAAGNLHRLSVNPYPGRGIVAGIDEKKANAIIVYWIMGRSPSSRNRIFRREGDRVFTDTIDKSMEVDPLTLYDAMDRYENHHIVSNGDQTATIMGALGKHRSFYDAMASRPHEDDKQNQTSRIAAMYSVGAMPVLSIGIIRKEDAGEGSFRTHWTRDSLFAGYGYCIHTYEGDVPAHAGPNGRLPPFIGEPRLVPLVGDLEGTAERWWNILDAENRVALVAKIIPLSGGEPTYEIINKADRT